MRAALSDPGTTVNVVARCRCARIISSQIPDLVILDLQIGNMGGWQRMDLRLEIDAERLSPVLI